MPDSMHGEEDDESFLGAAALKGDPEEEEEEVDDEGDFGDVLGDIDDEEEEQEEDQEEEKGEKEAEDEDSHEEQDDNDEEEEFEGREEGEDDEEDGNLGEEGTEDQDENDYPSSGSSSSSSSSEELELTVDDEGRLAFNGGYVNYSLRSFPCAFPSLASSSSPSPLLSTLLHDCHLASTARAQARAGGEYSEGETFFITAVTTPTAQLEAIALSIFKFHSQHAVFDGARSGAEWWVQVLDEDDDIGMHFDKDYSLEAHLLNIHPHLATVTYLSPFGGPTLILPLPCPLRHGEDLSCILPWAGLSLPDVGKHTVFDGRLLHAAPAELRGLWKPQREEEEEGKEEGRAVSRERVTLLVNVREIRRSSPVLPPLLLLPSSSYFSSSPVASRVTDVRVGGGVESPKLASWVLGGEAGQKYRVMVPLPAGEGGQVGRGEREEGTTIRLVFGGGLEGEVVREGKRKREEGGEGEEGSEEEEEEEEEEEVEEEEEEEMYGRKSKEEEEDEKEDEDEEEDEKEDEDEEEEEEDDL
ncbi:Hypothetical protein NocV09_05100080 [Nannochloropsis oceanica]